MLIKVQGIPEKFKEKLLDLVNGRWNTRRLSVGSKQQRDHMKVPIFRIKCNRKHWILWQIDVGTYDDLAVVKQIVQGMLAELTANYVCMQLITVFKSGVL